MATQHLNTAGQGVLLLALAVASLCSGAAAAPLTGLPLQPEQRMARALAQADTAHCDGGATVEHLLDGSAQGLPFRLFKVSCNYGNTRGEWQVVAFHDGSRYTRVLRFAALQIASPVAIDQDRIVYEAVLEKPGDARCCPSGRARVVLDTVRLSAIVQAIGFARRFEPVRGTLLK
jgi:hypothetical protein